MHPCGPWTHAGAYSATRRTYPHSRRDLEREAHGHHSMKARFVWTQTPFAGCGQYALHINRGPCSPDFSASRAGGSPVPTTKWASETSAPQPRGISTRITTTWSSLWRFTASGAPWRPLPERSPRSACSTSRQGRLSRCWHCLARPLHSPGCRRRPHRRVPRIPPPPGQPVERGGRPQASNAR